MNAIGILPLATGVFVFICAGICLRRAADPIGALGRMKQRYGIDYTRMISDPGRYAERVGRLSAFSGVFLIVVGLFLTIAGVVIMVAPSPEDQRARSAGFQDEIRRSQMQEYVRTHDERMKDSGGATAPAAGNPQP